MSDIRKEIKDIRTDYKLYQLDEQNADKNPLAQFEKWLSTAVEENVPEPNAFVLATANAIGRVSSRIVLLRSFDNNGFVFYTNYTSKKAVELGVEDFASMNFFWPQLERQVRIEGLPMRISAEESDAYFASRPRESQIGAWASDQSSVLPIRSSLDKRVKQFEEQFAGKEVPRPPHWGGYRIVPDYIEFWQGRPNRLHDRLVYKLEKAQWRLVRLYP